ITHTKTNGGKSEPTEIPNSAVTISCRNGKPIYVLAFASTKYGNSSFGTEQLASGAYHSGLYSEELGLYAQPNTSKIGNGLVSTYNIQDEINTIRIQLDPTYEKRHKEFCEKTARAIEITSPMSPNDTYVCQSRLLPSAPIAKMQVNGADIQPPPKISYACFDGQPRYKIAMDVPNSSEVEFLDFGISDGTISSATYYRRYDKTSSGRGGALVQNKKVEHKINVLESGTIGFPLKNNRLLRFNFDKEMLVKHQEWCAIGQQKQSYAIPLATDGTVTPQQTESNNVVPLIEN
ncbi:hypothetical protein K2X05_02500, partial [bacterium]|nr:hypothetical protein [bacterium]